MFTSDLVAPRPVWRVRGGSNNAAGIDTPASVSFRYREVEEIPVIRLAGETELRCRPGVGGMGVECVGEGLIIRISDPYASGRAEALSQLHRDLSKACELVRIYDRRLTTLRTLKWMPAVLL